jgi:glycosyltransferase involved in cell wall biosynthesis
LAAALRRVLANGELRRRLGEAARARMENQFGVEKFRRRHLEVYLHELERHGLGASQAALRPS